MFAAWRHLFGDALVGMVAIAVIAFLATEWAVWCCRDRSVGHRTTTQAD
jgi:hypothetical protein